MEGRPDPHHERQEEAGGGQRGKDESARENVVQPTSHTAEDANCAATVENPTNCVRAPAWHRVRLWVLLPPQSSL